MSLIFGHTNGPIEPAHDAGRTCKPPTASEMEEGGTYASERPACVGCAAPCAPRSVEVSLGDATATIDGQPATLADGMAALRQLNGEPPTRLEMLREMHKEATAALEQAEREERPNEIYLHGEAVAACEELIKYLNPSEYSNG